jgi:hypothetical protein
VLIFERDGIVGILNRLAGIGAPGPRDGALMNEANIPASTGAPVIMAAGLSVTSANRAVGVDQVSLTVILIGDAAVTRRPDSPIWPRTVTRSWEGIRQRL